MTQPDRPPGAGGAPGRRGCAPWLVGCLVVVLVVLIGGAAAAWLFVGRPIQQVGAAAQELARIGALDERVADRSGYRPPPDGTLEEAQVERYVAALRRVRGDLEARYLVLEERYRDVGGRRPEWTELPLLAGAYADFLRLLVQAKEAQVAALNAEGFSLEEYAWVRREVLRAAGLPGAGYDVGAFAQAMADDRPIGAAAPDRVPEPNRALVDRVRGELEDLAFLALLGL